MPRGLSAALQEGSPAGGAIPISICPDPELASLARSRIRVGQRAARSLPARRPAKLPASALLKVGPRSPTRAMLMRKGPGCLGTRASHVLGAKGA
jgi:hypothetical protein